LQAVPEGQTEAARHSAWVGRNRCSGKSALADPNWPSPFAETYLFIAFIYFVICFGISRYSAFLERRAGAGLTR